MKPIPKTRKVVPRPQIHIPEGSGLSGMVPFYVNAARDLADRFFPKTVPTDIELPNPGGWATKDDRLKDPMFRKDSIVSPSPKARKKMIK